MDREELLFLPERAAWARAVRMFGEYVARFSGNACWPQKRSQAPRLRAEADLISVDWRSHRHLGRVMIGHTRRTRGVALCECSSPGWPRVALEDGKAAACACETRGKPKNYGRIIRIGQAWADLGQNLGGRG